MGTYSLDSSSELELVATILSMKVSDESVGRIVASLSSDEWLNGCALTELAREYPAVGSRRIARLEAAVELGRRVLAARAAKKSEAISTPEQVVELVEPLVAGEKREHFWALCLDTKNHLLRLDEVSVGSLNASIVHPRELFRSAVSVSAAAMVIVHNHPSGDSSPSGADIQLTRRLIKAGDVVGIEVLDHVIIGSGVHSSLRELGLM